MPDTTPILEHADLPATLICPGHPDKQCLTLQEAVIDWRNLPEPDQQQASIRTAAGRVYSPQEIDRLHHA